MSQPWMVEMAIGGGWADAEWTENDKPMRFPSEQAANLAIDELIADVAEAVRVGHMEHKYRRRDYRAVPAN